MMTDVAAAAGCRSVMRISCATTMEYDSVVFDWKVKGFRQVREIASAEDLPPEGNVVTSPVYVDGMGGCWWLRMYPYEKRAPHEGKVSLFLHTDHPLRSDVYFSFQFTALDESAQPVDSSVGGVTLHKFCKSNRIRNFGFFDFIDGGEALARCLSADGALWIYCEVHIYSHVTTTLEHLDEPA